MRSCFFEMQLALFSQPFPLIQQSGMVGYRITRINPFRIRLQQGQLRFVESNSVGGRIGMPIRASGEKFIKRMLGSQIIFLWNACKWSQPHYFSHQQYLLMWM